MNIRPFPLLVCSSVALLSSPASFGDLVLPNFFSDHMVLQRDKPVVLWGMANEQDEVVVTFAGKTMTTTADAEGNWKLTMEPMSARSEGADLKVATPTQSETLKDVVVGEVWLASGQSNMAWVLKNTDDAAAEIAAADHPGIRIFKAKLTPAAEPQDEIGGEWLVCSPETAAGFTAVGYYFAENLNRELGVPVGILSSSWGGKPVETFTSREALASLPEGKVQLEAHDKAVAAYDPEKAKARHAVAMKKFDKQMAEWKAKPKESRGKAPRKPQPARNPAVTEGRPAVLYNGMISPFVGYTMRGAIWYQGESNARTPESATAYGKLFPLMIEDWRGRWEDEFSFLWVQLANFKKATNQPGAVAPWAVLQDEQRKTLALPKTGMAVTNDIGAANDIHPRNKKEVGRRLALWSLANDYGKEVTVSGPLFNGSEVEGPAIKVSFDHAKGLKSRDGGPLKRFEIAGQDKVWHWAEAKIDGDAVMVSSAEVAEPVAVRYAWAANPEGANLVNAEGLPASVFRTDDW